MTQTTPVSSRNQRNVLVKAAADFVTKAMVDGSYRTFLPLRRIADDYPNAYFDRRGAQHKASVFCSNDYLGMSNHERVVAAARNVLDEQGLGSGGSRNISGTSHYHVELEAELAALHGKESALLFNSGYVANEETLGVIGKLMPEITVLSDSKNHRSLIEGIRKSGLKRVIFEHNSVSDLEAKLKALPADAPKLIVLESIYSMDGHFGLLEEVCRLKHRHNAMIFLDETHGVGVYGRTGAGVADSLGLAHEIDMFQGGFGKAHGATGGYVVGDRFVVDAVRLMAPGFIFTTSLPPLVLAAALASVRHLKQSNVERERLFANVSLLKDELRRHGLPVMDSPSHIVPVMIGDSFRCKSISDTLLREHGFYVQPINFPSVPRGQERLRVIVSSSHTEREIRAFVIALAHIIAATS
ncbi:MULTISPECIES: 5-aminolevulinate synthase [Sorangium]|uniref:5-aminolevulinate synthase n=1 Tax=Sorangium atrum TaxID=2995308 RepID=A0ABT5BTZ3_9BACT|nr:5-aminolevulinate synthase [Sorangium aterium]MDC0676883.1 5-aminolevulinate synthase [Sorangium aterium]